MQRHVQVDEGIDLAADRLGHLLQVDQVEAEARAGAQQREDVVPQRRETLGAEVSAESFAQERHVVVAQIAAQPAQLARQAAAFQRKRQDEQQIARAIAAEDDGRPRALPAADVPLPFGEPIERLEGGRRRRPFERPPFPLDRLELAVHREHEPGARRAPDQAGGRSRRRAARPIAPAELGRDLLLRQWKDGGAFNDGYARRDKTVGHVWRSPIERAR